MKSRPDQVSERCSTSKPAAVSSSITNSSGTPCPSRFSGTPSGRGIAARGSKSMTARRPPGRTVSYKLAVIAAISVKWW
jgi:hypothetical protein